MIELVGMNTAELRQFAAQCGEQGFRGTQLSRWIYGRNARLLDEMTDLSKAFRQSLADQEASISLLEPLDTQTAPDGTTKYLFRLSDGGTVESVLLPYSDRMTACISTQVGCPIGCAFCATGASGFTRNLSAGEIVDQVRTINRLAETRITNVVFMGMGEPLLNWEATRKAISLLNEEMGIGMRQLTLSTSGVVPQMRELAELKLQLTLAVSLHAPTDALRDPLVPLNRRYPLAELRQAMLDYVATTNRRITIEYVMLHEVNDRVEHAQALASYLKGLHCQVNLIPFHEIGGEFHPSRPARMKEFAETLQKIGFPTTIRAERGLEIQAACGQLRRTREG